MENEKYKCFVIAENIIELELNENEGDKKLFKQTKKKIITHTVWFQELFKNTDTIPLVVWKILEMYATESNLDYLQKLKINSTEVWSIDNWYDNICFMTPDEY